MRYDLFETTADDFIADAVRETAGTDIGFTNGFRFGSPVRAGARSPRPTFGTCCRWMRG